MRKKILFTLAILFLGTTLIFAQKGSITAIVIDNETGNAIPYATVVVKNKTAQNSIQGGTTDNKGKVTVSAIEIGTYDVEVSFLGFQPNKISNIEITPNKLKVDLGKIKLNPSTISLQGVEVSALSKTSTSGIDRKTYKVSDFETAKGGTAVDVLNKLPSISVSPDGDVAVRGTSDFMVYINGKPTQTAASTILAQISSESIENIEVITIPTAKYEAQGKGGIINISTKRTGQKGLSITTNGLLGGSPWHNNTDERGGNSMNDNRYGGAANLLYNVDKWLINGGIFYNNRQVNGTRTGNARLIQPDGSYFHMDADGARPEYYEYYTANAGVDYQINKKSTVSANYFYGNRSDGRTANYLYTNYFGDADGKTISTIPRNENLVYNPNTDTRYGTFHTASLDYNLKNDDKSTLAMSLLYEHSLLTRNTDNKNWSWNSATNSMGAMQKHFIQSENTPLDGYRLSIAYEKPFKNGNKLGLGFQPQLLTHAGSFSFDTINTATNSRGDNAQFENEIDLKRIIYAGYIDFSGKVKKLSYIAGLRAEYTDQDFELTNANYYNLLNRPSQNNFMVNKLDLFPTLHVGYQFNDNNKATLAASRRINRPPTKSMAPFLARRHFEVYEVGDPVLKPEYLSNVEASFEKRIGKQVFNLTGFYRGTNNAIFRVNTVFNAEQVLIRSYTNAGNTSALGAELNANLELSPKVKVFLGGSLYNFSIEADAFGYKEKNSSTNWSMKGNINYLITKELKFTADADVKSATVTAQGQDYLFYIVNAAFSYAPKNMKGWDFSLKALDLLGSNTVGLNTRVYNTTAQQIFFQETEYLRKGQIVELTASYSINMNGKSKKKVESNFGKEQF